jgi:hypothetical protein
LQKLPFKNVKKAHDEFQTAERAMRAHICTLADEEVTDPVDHPTLHTLHQELIYTASVCHQVILKKHSMLKKITMIYFFQEHLHPEMRKLTDLYDTVECVSNFCLCLKRQSLTKHIFFIPETCYIQRSTRQGQGPAGKKQGKVARDRGRGAETGQGGEEQDQQLLRPSRTEKAEDPARASAAAGAPAAAAAGGGPAATAAATAGGAATGARRRRSSKHGAKINIFLVIS